LSPLPQRVPLDVHQSEPLEHPWASVRKLHYQIWPGIYSEAFLYVPKGSSDKPRPVILSMTGHWPNGKADAGEQKRCLNLARLGYVVLATDQDHFEDLPIGISHQTHMVWSNIRALDLIGTLPGVDPNRIGACGGSGGGYQTQMLLAVDDRIKVATIMGFTCDYRETVFSNVASCGCLHYPGALAIANMPEVSAQGMPVPVQYLTMDDYTKNFAVNAFPAIKQLYETNGYGGRLECLHWSTEHVYDKPKREATYRWMQKWLVGDPSNVEEPETKIFPVPRLLALKTGLPATTKKLEDLSAIYAAAHKYTAPKIEGKDQWLAYRESQTEALKKLLGVDRVIPVSGDGEISDRQVTDVAGIRKESFGLPVEANFRIPVTVLTPASNGPFKPLILCSGDGRTKLLQDAGPSSAMKLARDGRMVVLPDLRFYGDIALSNLIGAEPTSLMTFVPAYSQDEWLCNQDYSFQYHIDRAWERDSILWGRPLVGMMVTDIQKIIDQLAHRPDVELSGLQIVGRASKDDADYSVPLAVLFAAAMDQRLARVDVDLGDRSFEERTLPTVPFVLWHGDVLQWAACMGDRSLTVRNASPKAGDPAWLSGVFSVAGRNENLQLITQAEAR
jgi:dienelactone hydrolase